MAALTPTSVNQSPVRTDDVRDLISQITPAQQRFIDVDWLRACYAVVYGTTEVRYVLTMEGPRWTRPLACGSVESALQSLGTTDIMTWGVWLLIDRCMINPVPNSMPEGPWPWEHPAATAA